MKGVECENRGTDMFWMFNHCVKGAFLLSLRKETACFTECLWPDHLTSDLFSQCCHNWISQENILVSEGLALLKYDETSDCELSSFYVAVQHAERRHICMATYTQSVWAQASNASQCRFITLVDVQVVDGWWRQHEDTNFKVLHSKCVYYRSAIWPIDLECLSATLAVRSDVASVLSEASKKTNEGFGGATRRNRRQKPSLTQLKQIKANTSKILFEKCSGL